MSWHQLLAQPDSLTLPGYGLAGIVIAGLSTAVLKLYNTNSRLTDAAVAREREIAEKTLPILLKAAELFSATSPHIDRAFTQEDELTSTLRELKSFLRDIERRERRDR